MLDRDRSGSRSAGSSCTRARRGSCIARTSIGQGITPIQFTFLGYTFRPRKAVDKYGRVYVNFSPAVSREALKAMRQTIRGWHLQLMSDKSWPISRTCLIRSCGGGRNTMVDSMDRRSSQCGEA